MADAAPDASAAETIATHLQALGQVEPFPELALRACVARFQEARRPLRALLDRAAAGKPLSEEEGVRFFRGLHVLAAARDEDSFGSLLRLLRRPEEELEDLLGDALDISLPSMAIGLFDGDAEGLLALAADPKVYEIVRAAIIHAATYLTWEQRLERSFMQRFLTQFPAKRSAPDESPVWFAWMQAIALLGVHDLAPLVEKAWKAGRIDRSIQEWSEFGKDLARARTAYEDERRFAHLAVGPIDDIVGELDWTRDQAMNAADDGAEPLADTAAWGSTTPVTNPFRHVGRNDHCPCGSGRKAKKCCLANA